MLETILILLICIFTLSKIYSNPEATIRIKENYQNKFNQGKRKSYMFNNMDINDFEKRVIELKKRSRTGMLILSLILAFLVLTTLGHILMWSFQSTIL